MPSGAYRWQQTPASAPGHLGAGPQPGPQWDRAALGRAGGGIPGVPVRLIHRKGCFGLRLSAHFLSGHLPVTFGRQNQRALGNSQPPGLLLSE